jgi:hypothetical protein
MARYDDDYEDEDLDNDTDQDTDGLDDDAPDTSTDEGLIDASRDMLAEKCHLDLPPDTDCEKFLRDLYGALHGHPGIELVGTSSGSGKGDQLSHDAEGSDTRGPRMNARERQRVLGHRRRKKLSAKRQPHPKGVATDRQQAALAEVLVNCGLVN